ncbi:cathepsin W-like [Pelodytes ibericus]
MSLVHLLFTLVAFFPVMVSGNPELEQFEEFIIRFNKSYKSEEEFKWRLSIFLQNIEEARHLQRHELGTAKYGVTKFSDLTDEEFRSFHLTASNFPPPLLMRNDTLEVKSPPSCDWRKKGVISEVKNQELTCRSCWAFAAVGNIEAQFGILGNPKNLSVQQIIDCNSCGDGCLGGFPWDGFITVLEQGGLTKENLYKYQAKYTGCKTGLKPEGSITGFEMLPKNENAMASHLAQKGTLTVIVNSSALRHYQSGVIDQTEKHCSHYNVDHMVLIVGYSKEATKPYWILKNSYGISWGEQGYFRTYWGKNICGITMYPITAALSKKFKRTMCPP